MTCAERKWTCPHPACGVTLTFLGPPEDVNEAMEWMQIRHGHDHPMPRRRPGVVALRRARKAG